MIGFHKLLLFCSVFMLAAVSSARRDPDDVPRQPPGGDRASSGRGLRQPQVPPLERPPRQLHRAAPFDPVFQQEANAYILDHARSIYEERLHLPRGHLFPTFPVDFIDDRATVEQHLANPASRFIQIAAPGQVGERGVYATPWYAGDQTGRRGLLFVEIGPRNHLSMMHTGLRAGRVPETREDPWQYIDRIATLTRDDIRDRVGELRRA